MSAEGPLEDGGAHDDTVAPPIGDILARAGGDTRRRVALSLQCDAARLSALRDVGARV